jgi:ankyrin repeat protein
MKTKTYAYGVEKLNGYDAWALFEACALGDMPKARALLAKDQRLVNAQFWYEFPIHMAVRAGHAQIVELLLDRGADPGQSRFTYNSWDKLLLYARDRGHHWVESMLQRAMQKRFNYAPDFDVLKNAVITRDLRKIGAVLRRQPRLARMSDALGNNALHWSVITRQLGLIARFVEQGTPIDAHRADGQTPILLAVNGATDYWYRTTRSRSHPSLRNASVLVGSLLAHGAGYTISVAAAVGDQERLEQLLRKDIGLATRLDSARVSPLSRAAREGHVQIVRLLLDRGADPNTPEDLASDGRALFEACCGNHLEVVQMLLAHGANPNAGLDSSGCCLTIGEVYHGDKAKPIEQLLRKHGAYTPPYAMSTQEMKQAIRDGHPVVRGGEFPANVLRKRDAELLDLYLDSDRAAPDRFDFQSVVNYPRSSALIRKLLVLGLDPNRRDWLGKTFLHACAENACLPAAAVFLEAGADINARDFEFQGTPLAAAVRACGDGDAKQAKRRRRTVEFLLKRGAATNLSGEEPWTTPLAWANRRGHSEIVELLKHHGAT